MAVDLYAITKRWWAVTDGKELAPLNWEERALSSANDVPALVAEVETLRTALTTIAGAPSCSSIEWVALVAFIALTGEDMPADYDERLRVLDAEQSIEWDKGRR